MNASVLRTTTVVSALICALSSCSFFMPSHHNSNAREGERVIITMLKNCDDLGEEGKKAYHTVFETQCIEAKQKPLIEHATPSFIEPVTAAAAMAAVGLAVDFVANQLKQEAKLYEAQWEQRIAKGDFWSKSKLARKGIDSQWTQNYVGFLVCRLTSDAGAEALSAANGNLCDTPFASKMVFGFAPSQDQKFFLMAPLSFEVAKAKAKVLSDDWYTLYTPWVLATGPGKFARIQGHSIDVDVFVEMTAYWINDKKESAITPIASFKTTINGYDIEENKRLLPGSGLPSHPVGWLFAPPPSGAGPNDSSGNFTLRVQVTERDTLNAKRILEDAASRLEDKKPVIQNIITGK